MLQLPHPQHPGIAAAAAVSNSSMAAQHASVRQLTIPHHPATTGSGLPATSHPRQQLIQQKSSYHTAPPQQATVAGAIPIQPNPNHTGGGSTAIAIQPNLNHTVRPAARPTTQVIVQPAPPTSIAAAARPATRLVRHSANLNRKLPAFMSASVLLH